MSEAAQPAAARKHAADLGEFLDVLGRVDVMENAGRQREPELPVRHGDVPAIEFTQFGDAAEALARHVEAAS